MNVDRCRLWQNTDIIDEPMRENFELLETIARTSHWWRNILKCRCCGLTYFFEFYEEIDWEDGRDSQFTVWVPFGTDEQLTALKACLPKHMDGMVPRLCRKWSKDAEKPTIYWVS